MPEGRAAYRPEARDGIADSGKASFSATRLALHLPIAVDRAKDG